MSMDLGMGDMMATVSSPEKGPAAPFPMQIGDGSGNHPSSAPKDSDGEALMDREFPDLNPVTHSDIEEVAKEQENELLGVASASLSYLL